jgi:hypothetical protein
MRVQCGSPTLHAEMAALEDAGRLSAAATVYRDCTLVRFFFLHFFFLSFFYRSPLPLSFSKN